uniref:Cyclin-dependent kinases regulatory subunit n=1 Tax=Monodelphis domestica TaxID=13616 RepID=A0A5F8GAU2_MONDO
MSQSVKGAAGLKARPRSCGARGWLLLGGWRLGAGGPPGGADMSHKQIYYSDKYDDEEFEYRHVMLPKDIAKLVPKTHLMSESEWRNLGVQQSQGWVHYMIHEPGQWKI